MFDAVEYFSVYVPAPHIVQLFENSEFIATELSIKYPALHSEKRFLDSQLL